MGDPYYWGGYVAALLAIAGLGWAARRYVVVRRLLTGVTRAIHDRKDAAVGEETGEHAVVLRALTSRIASEMLERGLSGVFDQYLRVEGHNAAGSPLRDRVRRVGEAPREPEPLVDLGELNDPIDSSGGPDDPDNEA